MAHALFTRLTRWMKSVQGSHTQNLENSKNKCLALERLEDRSVPAIIGSTGQLVRVSAPISAEVNKLENANNAFVFAEKTQVSLTAPLKVDVSVPGNYSVASTLTPATILPGTIINSYYLHADVVGTPSVAKTMKGTITFDDAIIGLVLNAKYLASSDILGASKTVYSQSGREFDFNDPSGLDKISLSADRKSITYELVMTGASDDVRIVTSASSTATNWFSSDKRVKLLGQVELTPAQGTVEVNKNEDLNYAKIFPERTSVTLAAPLPVDVTRPGDFNTASKLTPGLIQAGTVVNSWYLHADVTGQPSEFRQMKGWITFESPVLGLVFSDSRLNLSNYLGLSTTIYSKAARQLDVGLDPNSDSISLSPDRKTVYFNSMTAPACDDLRIITAATPDPISSPQVLYHQIPGVTLGGQVESVPAPQTVEVNKNEDPNYAKLFAENALITLSSPLIVDVASPGAYNQVAALVPAAVAAGTVVNSYYLHADVTGQPVNFRLMTGSITFETPILGLVFSDSRLNTSNFLGLASTVYSSVGRRYDIGSGNISDSFTLSADRKTITFNSNTAPACDDMRIITAAKTVASAPLNLVVSSSTGGKVVLGWNTPALDGYAAITNYLVEYSRDGGKSWTVFDRQASSATSASVSGLVQGSQYIFRVAAINSVGKGSYSGFVTAKVA